MAVSIKRQVATRIIETETDLREGVAALKRCCPVMRKVAELAGEPPLRRSEATFRGLCRIVVGQQLSIASAEAIWRRTLATVEPFEPGVLIALHPRVLTEAGLSAAKIKTLHALAEAVAAGHFHPERLAGETDEAIHEKLVAVHGIGPWTADIFILFCLGRADAWAAGDLALQIASQHAFGLSAKPSAKELLELADRWRPWRGVAARLFWAYYAEIKRKKTALPL